jgi:hypothetical protein
MAVFPTHSKKQYRKILLILNLNQDKFYDANLKDSYRMTEFVIHLTEGGLAI